MVHEAKRLQQHWIVASDIPAELGGEVGHQGRRAGRREAGGIVASLQAHIPGVEVGGQAGMRETGGIAASLQAHIPGVEVGGQAGMREAGPHRGLQGKERISMSEEGLQSIGHSSAVILFIDNYHSHTPPPQYAVDFNTP